MKQTTLMISVPGVARTDVLLTEDRIYYRHATTDTAEDGELPGLKDRYLLVETRLHEAAATQGPAAEGVRMDLFVDNMRIGGPAVNEQGLRLVVSELTNIDEAFGFLRGFL